MENVGLRPFRYIGRVRSLWRPKYAALMVYGKALQFGCITLRKVSVAFVDTPFGSSKVLDLRHISRLLVA
jgi:hypothetical protein